MKSVIPFAKSNADRLINNKTSLWRRPGFPISLLIIIYLAVGLLVVTQYGASLDEIPRIQYADRSLAAYLGRSDNLQDEKGPFYGMFALVSSKVLVFLFPGWKFIDGWHYMNFLAFVMGIYFFYRLCRRLVDPGPAFAATLLFSTQPLLWGHAFINPKDIPFMAFFLASVTLGLEMVDHFQAQAVVSNTKTSVQDWFAILRQKIASGWKSASARLRVLLIGLALLLAGLVLSYRLIQVLIAAVIRKAYTDPPSSWLASVFRQRALHAGQVPLQAYVTKAHALYSWLALFLGIALALAFFWVTWLVFPSIIGRFLRFLAQPRVWLAGCFLGFSSDIRTLGPASGLLVAVYFLSKAGRKAILVLLEYLGVGTLTIYLFWPYLWNAPLKDYLSSLSQTADYPMIGNLLFGGNIYSIQNPPVGYLPVLFTVQFTETALGLIVVGFVVAGFYLIRKANLRMDLLLLGVWFVAPVAAAIILHSTLYNNFRQFLFVVPTLFILAGLALQAIRTRLKDKPVLLVSLIILAVLPALYWDWQLHPYQYVYYNSLVGGVAGASSKFETDYWTISYKEAINYVDQVAPKNSTVAFWGGHGRVTLYARPDLTLIYVANSLDPGYPFNTLADYAILSTSFNIDKFYFPGAKEIFQVQRGGATLAVVKKVNKGDLIQVK